MHFLCKLSVYILPPLNAAGDYAGFVPYFTIIEECIV